MKETNFKVLMYMDKYVDANLLYTGIYWRTVPNLYPKDDTIETLIERGRAIKDMDGNSLITEEYIQNLKECQLVPIVIMEANSILPSIDYIIVLWCKKKATKMSGKKEFYLSIDKHDFDFNVKNGVYLPL